MVKNFNKHAVMCASRNEQGTKGDSGEAEKGQVENFCVDFRAADISTLKPLCNKIKISNIFFTWLNY